MAFDATDDAAKEADYIRMCLDGQCLYGDEVTEEQLLNWFDEERNGYFNLVDHRALGHYEYHALNQRTLFRHLADRTFDVCLGFGCSYAEDIEPLAPQVAEYVVIEPSTQCWRPEIGGKPARFIEPTPTGAIPLPDKSVDLVVAISSLHHVPRVSFIISEFARVLRKGGVLAVREPHISMEIGVFLGLASLAISAVCRERGFRRSLRTMVLR